jgi:hypothetical protein
MTLFDPPGESEERDGQHERPPSRGRLFAAVGVLVAIAAGAYLLLWPGRAPERPSEPPATSARAPEARPAPVEKAPAARPRDVPPPEARRRPARSPAPVAASPAPEAAPKPAPPALRVECDVEGALVFVDREYLGVAPLTTRAVRPGTRQLNVSAEGFEGVARTVDVAVSGTTEVRVSLREVRLNASVPVVHKHAAGSCEGRLVATTSGVRYETSHAKDGFSIPFEALEAFELDYLADNLRMKQRGGRAWNFRSVSDRDALFTFHRDVMSARKKLGR